MQCCCSLFHTAGCSPVQNGPRLLSGRLQSCRNATRCDACTGCKASGGGNSGSEARRGDLSEQPTHTSVGRPRMQRKVQSGSAQQGSKGQISSAPRRRLQWCKAAACQIAAHSRRPSQICQPCRGTRDGLDGSCAGLTCMPDRGPSLAGHREAAPSQQRHLFRWHPPPRLAAPPLQLSSKHAATSCGQRSSSRQTCTHPWPGALR